MGFALCPRTSAAIRDQGIDLVGRVGKKDIQQLGDVIGAKLGDKNPKDRFVE
jgi:hypothetical protein